MNRLNYVGLKKKKQSRSIDFFALVFSIPYIQTLRLGQSEAIMNHMRISSAQSKYFWEHHKRQEL